MNKFSVDCILIGCYERAFIHQNSFASIRWCFSTHSMLKWLNLFIHINHQNGLMSMNMEIEMDRYE